jgi:SRSO17 transposase
VRNGLPGPRIWAALRRSFGARVELKFHLRNAPLDCERRDLEHMIGWCLPIRTSLEEAKGEVGLDDDATHSLLGWHHQLVQSFMARFILIRLRLPLHKNPGAHDRSGPSVGDLCLAGRRPTLHQYNRYDRIS